MEPQAKRGERINTRDPKRTIQEAGPEGRDAAVASDSFEFNENSMMQEETLSNLGIHLGRLQGCEKNRHSRPTDTYGIMKTDDMGPVTARPRYPPYNQRKKRHMLFTHTSVQTRLRMAQPIRLGKELFSFNPTTINETPLRSSDKKEIQKGLRNVCD